jgi:hypothetical protein
VTSGHSWWGLPEFVVGLPGFVVGPAGVRGGSCWGSWWALPGLAKAARPGAPLSFGAPNHWGTPINWGSPRSDYFAP